MIDTDKRRFFRKGTSNVVFYEGNGIKGIGRTQNISLKGALIETDKKPPPVSSHLKLAIGVEKFYGLTAKVVWIKKATIDKWYFGVEFDNIQKFPALNIMEIKLKSPVFKEGDMIPKKYTCDGEDISPPLSWEMLPEETQSLALVCDDPDAPLGTWVHWVIFDIPSYIAELPEGIPPKKILENGIKQGKNDFGKIGYGGPCPPEGIHRYYFKLYALNKKLILEPGITKDELLEAMKGYMLAQGQLMGRYKS